MTDTEKAIEWFKENLPPLEDYGEMIGAPPQYCGIKFVYNDPCGYAFETAIQALQEKAERDKGCEYCNDYAVEGACDSDAMMRIDKGNEHCMPYIAVNNDTYGTSDIFDINYCPMCGRNLNNPTDEH